MPTPSNRIPIPPSQRAMNSGFGARILGRSSVTAHSCAITAIPPPIAASLPPRATAITTRTAPKATRSTSAFTSPPYRPLPSVYLPSLTVGFSTVGISLHPIVDAHEAGEPADKRTDDREQRPRVDPPVEKPPTCPKQQDRDREVERHPEVLVALAVAPGLRPFVFLCGSHCCAGKPRRL